MIKKATIRTRLGRVSVVDLDGIRLESLTSEIEIRHRHGDLSMIVLTIPVNQVDYAEGSDDGAPRSD